MGSFLKYKRRSQLLTPHHQGAIIAIAISPSGRYIASASVDGVLCIWILLHPVPTVIIRNGAGLVSLTWVDDRTLLSGSENGTLIAVVVDKSNIETSGILAHDGKPLECIAVKPGWDLIATGAHDEVKVWSFKENLQSLVLQQSLPRPPITAYNHGKLPIVVTSLHWAQHYDPSALIVCYLHHGVVIWDGAAGTVLTTLPLRFMIGSSSLSGDHTLLAISGIFQGIVIFDLKARTIQKQRDDHDGHDDDHYLKSQKRSLPIKFVHGDHAAITGSAEGILRLWSIRTLEPLQFLELPGIPSPLLAIDGFDDSSTFLLACSTTNLPQNYVQVWEAQQTDDYAQIQMRGGGIWSYCPWLCILCVALAVLYTRSLYIT